MRKILHIFLSLVIVYASTQTAFAASSWSITSAVSAGSRTVVSATKSGYKSAVNIAPSAGRLALKLGKGANWAALLYAAIQLAPDIADIDSFKPNYANNTVDYKTKLVGGYTINGGCTSVVYPTPESICSSVGKSLVKNTSWPGDTCGGSAASRVIYSSNPICGGGVASGSVSISDAAAQVIKNANSGHAPSQAATRETATEMVVGGQFDQDLLQGAVPTSDTKPLVPSVPISGNGNVTHGSDIGVGDSGMSGSSPGEQSDAAKDAADKAKKAAQAAADAAKDAAQAAADAADAAADLVNSGADTAAIDAANAKAAAAEKAAADAKAVSDAAVAAANERAAAAERAAEAATQAAQAAVDKAAADVAAAQAAGDAAAIAAAEAAKAAADAAVAAAKEKQAAAEKAAEKAKAEAAKPFELPAFCSWATPVCDAIEWLKRDPSDVAPIPVDVDASVPSVDASEFDVEYINFGGQCPSLPSFSVGIGGASSDITFDMTPLCNLAVTIRPAIIAISYFIGLGVVASAIRET